MLPHCPGQFSVTFLATTFSSPGRTPTGRKQRFSDFWAHFGPLTVGENSGPGRKTRERNFPVLGALWGGNPAAQKVSPRNSATFLRFSSKFRDFFIFYILADRTPTGGESRNTGFLVRFGLGQPLVLGEIPGGQQEKRNFPMLGALWGG